MFQAHLTTGPTGTRREEGFALISVLVFAFILGLVGVTFFAMSSYETGNALYREASSEAFYLADGAIERARGEFLNDLQWRGPITGDSLGTGSYSLTATDTTWVNGDPAVLLHAEGLVRGARRGVEAWVELAPPGAFVPLLVMQDIDVGGNFCLDGNAHANGDADFGPGDTHLKCGGTYTEGFEITPPAMYTEPGYYPGSTYYFVKVIDTVPLHARILAADGVTDVTTAKGDSLVDILKKKASVYEIDFSGDDAFFDFYFDPSSGVFSMDVGDSGVVVNFAHNPGSPPRENTLIFKMTGSGSIPATIINSRFKGASVAQRLDDQFWAGGVTEIQTKATFGPLNGLALVTHILTQSNSQVVLGTPADPALTYVTKDVDKINGDLTVNGSMMVLGDFISTGGPSFTFNPGFISKLPGFLSDAIPGNSSGIMRLLAWSEVAVGP